MLSYDAFAIFYDELMQDVDYKKRAEFFLEKLNDINHSPGLTLDLACGTGGLMFELLKRGIDAFGADASMQMLSRAKDKAYDYGFPDAMFICQKMQELELFSSVDTVMCMLDGINHLPSFADVEDTFERVYKYLNPGGVFIFDMNTVYKHREILSDSTFIYDMENVFCCWQNLYNSKDESVNITLDFFAREKENYRRFTENFKELAYDEGRIEASLINAGFSEVHMYSSPGEELERKVVMAKRG